MNNNSIINKYNITIKIILATLMFLCLFPMPYGYYQMLRFLALIAFSFFGYQEFKNDNKIKMIIWLSLAILFQPIFKISIGRIIWNIVDVIVGIYLIINAIIESKK